MYLEEIYVCIMYIFFQERLGNLTPPSWKMGGPAYVTSNIMAVDDLATQGARSSADMILTRPAQNILLPALIELNCALWGQHFCNLMQIHLQTIVFLKTSGLLSDSGLVWPMQCDTLRCLVSFCITKKKKTLAYALDCYQHWVKFGVEQ